MFDEGFDFVLRNIELRYLVPLGKRLRFKMEEKKEIPLGIRLRRLFEKLGPTFVKFGQILSMRPDLVGQETADELSKLQDRASPFDPRAAKHLIEKELGKPISKFFKQFDEKPAAAASLAQVHRAVLKNGEVVALKIQRPQMKEIIEEDVHLMFHLAKLLEKMPEIAIRRPVDLVKEFAESTFTELDFELEAQRMERLRQSAEQVKNAKVPKVFWAHTTTRLLTMEYVEGKRIDDAKALKKADINPKNLAKIGAEVLFRQYFIDGFFQADPHPGNFFALKDDYGNDVLCLHDFGMVGFLNHESRSGMLKCISTFAAGNVEGYIESIMRFAILGEGADIEGFRRKARLIAEKMFFSPSKARAIAQILQDILNAALGFRVRFPTNLALFARSFFILSNVGAKLDPDFDLTAVANKFLKIAAAKEVKSLTKFEGVPSKIFEYIQFAKYLPERTQKLLEKIEKGELDVKINLSEIKNLKAELDRENDIRIFAILTGTIFIGSVILTATENRLALFGAPVGYIGLAISVAMFLWLLRLIKQKAR